MQIPGGNNWLNRGTNSKGTLQKLDYTLILPQGVNCKVFMAGRNSGYIAFKGLPLEPLVQLLLKKPANVCHRRLMGIQAD